MRLGLARKLLYPGHHAPDLERCPLCGPRPGQESRLHGVLLISGGLFLTSMAFAHSTSPGFDRTGVQLFSVDLGLQGYKEQRGRLLHKNLVEGLTHLPGVESASVAYPLPLDAYNDSGSILVEGYVPRSDNEDRSAGLATPTNFDPWTVLAGSEPPAQRSQIRIARLRYSKSYARVPVLWRGHSGEQRRRCLQSCLKPSRIRPQRNCLCGQLALRLTCTAKPTLVSLCGDIRKSSLTGSSNGSKS